MEQLFDVENQCDEVMHEVEATLIATARAFNRQVQVARGAQVKALLKSAPEDIDDDEEELETSGGKDEGNR